MHESLNMLVILAAILIGARLAGHFSNRLGMPVVFGELLLGLVLGPAVAMFIYRLIGNWVWGAGGYKTWGDPRASATTRGSLPSGATA